jgi:hypothetical protein
LDFFWIRDFAECSVFAECFSALGKVFAECPIKNTRQRAFADVNFVVCSLPGVALGKAFAECKKVKTLNSSSDAWLVP